MDDLNEMDTSTDMSNSADGNAAGHAAKNTTATNANSLHSKEQPNLNDATPSIQLPTGGTWANTVLNGKSNALGPKPSPIQLAALDKANYAIIINGLFEKFNGQGYRWHQLKSFSLPRILTDDLGVKGKIMAWLDEKQIEYNTFAERGQKRKAFLLRGLMHGDDTFNINSIGSALHEVGVTGNAAITRFLTGFMKRNPNDNAAPIYQITLDHDADDSNLLKIATINNFCVRFEKMKPSRVIQCHRCQRFSHTAASCSHKYRCVQCVHSHEPGSCPRLINKNLPLGCVNCADAELPHAGHTANDYHRCGFYAKINNQLAAGKDNKKTDARNTVPHNVSSARFQTNKIEEQIHANNPWIVQNKKKRRNTPTQNRSTTSSSGSENININSKNKNAKANGKSSVSQGNSNNGVSNLVNALLEVLARFN